MRVRLLIAMIFVAVTLCSALGGQQSQPPTKARVPSDAALAKPLDWGIYAARLFSDSDKISFSLMTSWIPGENHKGMMRYKLNAYPEHARAASSDAGRDSSEVETTRKLMNAVHACTITLDLYDADGLILRKIAVTLDLGVDDQARLRNLTANDSVQMDGKEYRTFIGPSKDKEGSWNVSWVCRHAVLDP